MSEKLNNIEADLKAIVLSNDEREAIPLMQAELILEGVRALTSIAESLAKIASPSFALNKDGTVTLAKPTPPMKR